MVERESYIVLNSSHLQSREERSEPSSSREASPKDLQARRNSSPLRENDQNSDPDAPTDNMHFRHEASMVHAEHETSRNCLR
jgi:hypothetical protein